MKQFNFQEYLANPSRKVITRDGKPVQILCTNARREYSIIALVERNSGKDYLFSFLPDGTMYYNKESINDLFFAPIKKESQINLFRHVYSTEVSIIFDTKEEAAKNSDYGKNPRFIKTIHIEWEE